ncbi:MAG: redoxin family protein [Alphaproteobacteria bacterium]|nr:redoxin family protein [Alphaproteobacteria bacterium]
MIRLVLACLLGCDLLAAPTPPPLAVPPRPGVPQVSRQVDVETLRALLEAPSDHVRVYVFWASWCAPCIAEFPILKSFAAQHPDVDVVLVNVDSLAVQSARVPGLVSRHGLLQLEHIWLVSSDPNRALKQAVTDWPEAIPTALVVRPDGVRQAMHVESVDGATLASSVRAARQPRPKQP